MWVTMFDEAIPFLGKTASELVKIYRHSSEKMYTSIVYSRLNESFNFTIKSANVKFYVSMASQFNRVYSLDELSWNLRYLFFIDLDFHFLESRMGEWYHYWLLWRLMTKWNNTPSIIFLAHFIVSTAVELFSLSIFIHDLYELLFFYSVMFLFLPIILTTYLLFF